MILRVSELRNDDSCLLLSNTRTIDENTQIAAANIGWQILSLMAKTPLVE